MPKPANQSGHFSMYLAILAALISGISVFINKFAVGAFSSPLIFTAIKNSGVGLLLIGVLILTKKWPYLKKLNRRDIVGLVVIGVVGGSLPFYLFFTGLAQTSAINAAIIQKTLVLWVAILAVPLLKERLTRLQVAAVVFLFSANFIIGGFSGFKFSQGELLILAATILWAVETTLAKKVLQTVDSSIVVAARMILGSLILLTATFLTIPGAATKIASFGATSWLWVGLTAVLLFGYVTVWYKALKLAPAITVTAVLVSATLVTNLLSAVFLTHSWDATLTLQTGLMLLGMGLLLLSPQQSKNSDLLPLPVLKP